ncbi:MAG: signal peptidase I [Sandaracinus sp.]|nr:signal peptidase I [Sandaracinus sp.]
MSVAKDTPPEAADETRTPAEAERAKPKPAKKDDEGWDRFKANVRTIGGAVLLAVFIRIVLFEAFEIDGPSMEPTLLNGDRVVVAKMLYGLFLPKMNEAVLSWGEPHLGDVIIVHSPADDVDIVKRVMGVPGDTVQQREDGFYRNGELVERREVGPCNPDERLEDPFDDLDECIIYEETVAGRSFRISDSGHGERIGPPVTVPPGHVYVRGDHRDRSNDSTNPHIGAVPIERVKGRALFIYLSCDDEPGGVNFCDRPRWPRFFDSVR